MEPQLDERPYAMLTKFQPTADEGTHDVVSADAKSRDKLASQPQIVICDAEIPNIVETSR